MGLIKVGGRIVFECYRQVIVVIDVDKDRLDTGNLAVKEHVLGVGALEPGTQADTAALGQRDAAHLDPVCFRLHRCVLGGIPPRRLGLLTFDLPQVANRAMKTVEHLRRHVIDAVDERRCARIGGAGFALLLLGQRHLYAK